MLCPMTTPPGGPVPQTPPAAHELYEPSGMPPPPNHLTHHVDDWGGASNDRDGIIAHLSAHPEHAWRYPPGYDFSGKHGLTLAVAHRRHHQPGSQPADITPESRAYD